MYKLQLVQTASTSCNLYRIFVQVAACTKSQLVHNIYMSLPTLSSEYKIEPSENTKVWSKEFSWQY